MTIKNLIFSADSINAEACINLGAKNKDNTRYTDNVSIVDCQFDVADAAAIKSYTGGDKNLKISNCTVSEEMHSLLQIPNIDGVEISSCTVNSKNGVNLNSTPKAKITGCTFNVKGYAVRFGVTPEVGKETVYIDEAEYTIEDCALQSACAETGDAVIIFRTTAQKATLNLTNNTTLIGTTKISGNTEYTTIKGTY